MCRLSMMHCKRRPAMECMEKAWKWAHIHGRVTGTLPAIQKTPFGLPIRLQPHKRCPWHGFGHFLHWGYHHGPILLAFKVFHSHTVCILCFFWPLGGPSPCPIFPLWQNPLTWSPHISTRCTVYREALRPCHCLRCC